MRATLSGWEYRPDISITGVVGLESVACQEDVRRAGECVTRELYSCCVGNGTLPSEPGGGTAGARSAPALYSFLSGLLGWADFVRRDAGCCGGGGCTKAQPTLSRDRRPRRRAAQGRGSRRPKGSESEAVADRARGCADKPVGAERGRCTDLQDAGAATRSGPTMTEERSDEHPV
jgi:hypothetical protein